MTANTYVEMMTAFGLAPRLVVGSDRIMRFMQDGLPLDLDEIEKPAYLAAKVWFAANFKTVHLEVFWRGLVYWNCGSVRKGETMPRAGSW